MVLGTWARSSLIAIVVLGCTFDGTAARVVAQRQGGPATLPPLFFREAWKRPPYTGELNDENRRITQDAVTSQNLELKLYGTDARNVLIAGTAVGDPLAPLNVWTGLAASPVAVTLRDRTQYLDLTGNARVRWVTRASSLHVLHPVVKLADGTLLVGDHTDAPPNEFLQSEFSFARMRWFKLDPVKVITTVEVTNPDLGKVDEVGFADLMPGGGHGTAGWINVGPWELYAKPVKR
jgi:hypothetical protein